MGAIAQVLWMKSTTETGLLKDFLTGLWGAYALVPLRSLYAGSAIRVRRSSDNTEQDIGFSAGALDTASLATFVGSNDGFITKWYDQSGGANDLAQATSANQPQIVVSGVYAGEVLFDGTNDELTTANNSNAVPAFTLFCAGRSRLVDTSVRSVTKNSAGPVFNAQDRDTSLADNYEGSVSTGTGTSYTNSSCTRDGTVYVGRANRAEATIADENKQYVAGVLQSSIRTSGSTTTGNFSAGTWTLGSSTGASWSRLATRCFLIYENAWSDADIASISALIPPSVVVDGFSSDLTSCYGLYSLRRQNSAFAGSAIRVRRSSDNAEQDIGFVSGLLDTASMLTFTGANNGFVTKFYDQSGNGHDFVQATAANQPQIVTSGALTSVEGMHFDGSNDILDTAVNGGTGTTRTLYVKGHCTQLNASQGVLLELTANSNGVNGALYIFGNVLNESSARVSGTVGNGQSNYDTNILASVQAAVLDRAGGTIATQTKLYSGGVALTAASTSGATQSGNFQADKWHLGGRSGGTIPFTGEIESVAIYETAHTAATIERLSKALG